MNVRYCINSRTLPTRLCIDPAFPIAEYFSINWGFVWADEAKEAENATPSTRLERRVMVFICGDDGCRGKGAVVESTAGSGIVNEGVCENGARNLLNERFWWIGRCTL
ncbi:hypothetical protein CDAR_173141 [Caerostris darwini]|uniref:Uncharacterized protein n=1 Tax=Caerostris darwini TaxID=1538125 RepID=A0AAV4WIJ0_9ARAC|nr:hypothetical protein CDAR_173141 [Caerostris darwini]